MDVEKLNKSQIILLTLLVSFMTSIATGIVTVSLMEQAPPAITQTVNKVIEHTVEKVVPGQAAAAAVPTQVVVRESDMIAKAVEKVSPSVVRLYTSDADAPVFLGLGIVIDGGGTIAVDSAALGESADATIELSGSARIRGFVRARDATTGIAYIAAATSTADGGAIQWQPASLSSAHQVLGQTAATVAGRSAIRLATGLITAISPLEGGPADGVLETSISPDSIVPGSPLFDTSGAVIGLSTGASRTVSTQGFIAAALVGMPKETDASGQ